MADQSQIQSLIQQLAGTHSAGQQNLPSGVNNGNPNTIYNVSPSQGGYLPPVSNGFDQWRINPMPDWQKLSMSQTLPQWATKPAVDWQQLAMSGAGGGMAGFGGFGGGTPGGGFHWPPPPVVNPGTGGTPPPGGTGTPPPPGGTGAPTPGVGTGGVTPPIPVTGTGGGGFFHSGGGGTQATGAGRGLDLLDLPPGDLGFSDTRTAENTGVSGTLDSSHGWGDLSAQDIQETLGANLNLGGIGQSLANTSLGRALGIQPDGSISAGQILDFFIPGNVFMGQTGKLNLLNMVPALLSKINPLLGAAAKAAMTWLANHTNIKALKNWQQRNLDNRLAGRGGGGTGVQDPTRGGAGSFMGGSYGWDGRMPGSLGNVVIGGSGPGSIAGSPTSDFVGSGGLFGAGWNGFGAANGSPILDAFGTDQK